MKVVIVGQGYVGLPVAMRAVELVTMSVIQALLGYTSEARFIRHAHLELRHLFPYIPDLAPLQQTTPPRRRHAQRRDPAPRHLVHQLVRRHLAARFHPGRMRPLP